MREPQLHCGAAFWAELLQHDPEPGYALACIEIPVELWQGLEPLLRRSLVDVDAARPSSVECRVLLHEVIGHGLEVVDGTTDRLLVADPKHPYVHLLSQIRCIGLASDAPPEEGLQRAAVLGKQPLDQRWFRLSRSHGDPYNSLSSCI
jgi:hypothetical protein